MANTYESMASSQPTDSKQPFTTAPAGVTGAAFQSKPSGGPSPGGSATPLSSLEMNQQQTIDCPNCKVRAQTRVKGRSKGKEQFMNVFWWPLPNRKHWWETTHWFCENCDIELATQKYGKELIVLV